MNYSKSDLIKQKELYAEKRYTEIQIKDLKDPQKIFSFLLGFQLVFWYLEGGGVEWWWKFLPYIISTTLASWGIILFGKNLWRFDWLQRTLSYSLLLYICFLILRQSANFRIELAQESFDIVVKNSWFTTIDQILFTSLFGITLCLSSAISRFVSKGKFLLTVGIILSTIIYGSIRLYCDKILQAEIYGTINRSGFSNENAFGFILSLAVLMCLVFVLTKNQKKIDIKEKTISLVLLLLVIPLVIINGSRGGIFSLLLSITILIFFYLFKRLKYSKKKFHLLPFSFMLILSFVVAYFIPDILNRHFSSNDLDDPGFRLVIWSEVLRQIPDFWLFGVGVNCFRFRFNSGSVRVDEAIFKHADSGFMTILYEQGLLIFLAILGALTVYAWLAINQKNRSWRTATLGLAVVSLVIIHGMFETLFRFHSINLSLSMLLGMLHGQSSLKSGLKNLKSNNVFKILSVLLLGATFIWGLKIRQLNILYDKAVNLIRNSQNNDGYESLIKYIQQSYDEFDRLGMLVLVYRENTRGNDIVRSNIDKIQKLYYVAEQLRRRQPSEPISWQTLAYCKAIYPKVANDIDLNTDFNENDLEIEHNIFSNAFKINKPINWEFVDFITTKQKLSLNNSSLIMPSDCIDLSYYKNFPNTKNIYILPYPELAEINNYIRNRAILENIFRLNFDKNTALKLNKEIEIEIRELHISWTKSEMSNKNTFIKNNITNIKKINNTYDSALNMAKSVSIYPGLLMMYRDALVILGIYRPKALNEFYDLLSESQKKMLWRARERYLVYEPKLSIPDILDWVIKAAPDSEKRIRALAQRGNMDLNRQATILEEIFNDPNSQINARLDAAILLRKIRGPEFFINKFPPDLESVFDARAYRYLAAVSVKSDKLNQIREQLGYPDSLFTPRLLIEVVDMLAQEGHKEQALKILRMALESTKAAEDARLRTAEILRRIRESGQGEDSYLVRLNILARTENASPNEILDFLNMVVLKERGIMVADFLSNFIQRGWSLEQSRELDYYRARIARLENDLEKETRLAKDLILK